MLSIQKKGIMKLNYFDIYCEIDAIKQIVLLVSPMT